MINKKVCVSFSDKDLYIGRALSCHRIPRVFLLVLSFPNRIYYFFPQTRFSIISMMQGFFCDVSTCFKSRNIAVNSLSTFTHVSEERPAFRQNETKEGADCQLYPLQEGTRLSLCPTRPTLPQTWFFSVGSNWVDNSSIHPLECLIFLKGTIIMSLLYPVVDGQKSRISFFEISPKLGTKKNRVNLLPL